VTISTTATTPSLLVLADQAFPGWVAALDGHPTPVLTADHALRAVYVPPGVHRVRFSYEPDSFRMGALATLGSALLLIALVTWERLRLRARTRANGSR
jgi:uncharacterized membrane protein YfhO